MFNPVSDPTRSQSQHYISIENQPKSSFFSRICSCFCKAKVDKSSTHIQKATAHAQSNNTMNGSKAIGQVTFNESAVGITSSDAADDFVKVNGLVKRVTDKIRLSPLKKEKDYQTTTINLHKHTLSATKNQQTVTKTIFRSGAPATHGGKQMKKLLSELEKDLGIKDSKNLGPTERYNIIEKSKNPNTPKEVAQSSSITSRICSCFFRAHVDKTQIIEENFNELELQRNNSVAQMLAKFEAAVESSKGSQSQKPFVHIEHSMLSPTTYKRFFGTGWLGSCKEESLLMQTEMAIDYINKNFKIVIDRFGQKKIVNKTTPNSTEASDVGDQPQKITQDIKIILIQTAVNEYTGYGQKTENRINLNACESLNKLLGSSSSQDGSLGGIDDTASLVSNNEDTHVAAAREAIENPGFTLWKVADLSISRNLMKAAKELDATYGILCKSGKDRTAQGVADLFVEELKSSFDQAEMDDLRKAVQEGVSYKITGLNTGKSNGYAFNLYQRNCLPKDLRPNWWKLCSSGLSS